MTQHLFRLVKKMGIIAGTNPAHVPLPSEEMQLGAGNATADEYLKIGRTRKEDIFLRTDVEPTASILDIGCGSGRIAGTS